MVTIKGTVEGIIYRNDDNGYTVFVLATDDSIETVTGTFPLIREGDFINVFGLFVEHENYGTQFKAESYEIVVPETVDEVEAYLSSGIIRGVGPKTARDIVDYFGSESLKIIEKEPEKLTLVSGIGKSKAQTIYESFSELQGARRTVMFLQKFDVTPKMALKIYTFYGDSTIELLQENPYRLVSDIEGIGFITADKIASSMGLDRTSKFRIGAGLKYLLMEAANEGHTFLPYDVLLPRAALLMAIDEKDIEKHLESMTLDGTIMQKYVNKIHGIYHPLLFYAENFVSAALIKLQMSVVCEQQKNIEKEIASYEKEKKITLAENQRLAVISAINNGICIITGGPGTGKTTTLDCILHLFRKRGIDIMLCAPTGRAAKRMSNATGEEAKTVHRLLEYSKVDEGNFTFKRNNENPLPKGVCIVDEASMLDIFLMQALLNALEKGTRLILVGDSDQLPSVGAGNVLGDMISSDVFRCVKLDEVFRQAKESNIITNAHKINHGQMPVVNAKDGDFFLDRRRSEQDIMETVVDLCKRRLPNAYKYSPFSDIQVLTPVKKGLCGVFNLNKLLQKALNPPERNKKEHIMGEDIFRVGDKVMQIKNNYDRQWNVFDKYGNAIEGTGVFNGDVGIITEIDVRELTVKFEDERISVYGFQELDELTLAYAISVHKSQGCEFPVVVMPLPLNNFRIMTRNLLYTAVTRASKLVVLCGTENSIAQTINNIDTQKRYSGLNFRLKMVQEALKTTKF